MRNRNGGYSAVGVTLPRTQMCIFEHVPHATLVRRPSGSGTGKSDQSNSQLTIGQHESGDQLLCRSYCLRLLRIEIPIYSQICVRKRSIYLCTYEISKADCPSLTNNLNRRRYPLFRARRTGLPCGTSNTVTRTELALNTLFRRKDHKVIRLAPNAPLDLE